MNNKDLFRTIMDETDFSNHIDLSGSIEYEPDKNDSSEWDGKTVLDELTDDYVQYANDSGFSFEAEGLDEDNEMPLSNYLQPDMTLKDNRYKINRVVGAGGFGVVYRAYDQKLNIPVAIKELYPSSLVNRVPGEKKMIIYGKDNARQYAYLLDRFILEARSMAKFNSIKNIVNIFDCFQENNTAYIVMEFIEGKTIEQYVENNGGKLDVETANKIMCGVLDGLSAIHGKGIVHRDIKPKNIFITNDNTVKIIDFGAARFSSTEETVVTRYSKVLTPGFAPPEQYRKDSKQGSYTDIYAASAVYYYMITGIVPEISVDRVVKDDLKPLRAIDKNIPECVDRAIGRALELNSDLRLQTASELKSGLLGKKLIRTVKEEKKTRFRRRILIVAATAAMLCIAAVGVVAYKFSHAKDISVDKLVKDDVTLSVMVPLSSNSSMANSQLSAWDNMAERFEQLMAEESSHSVSVELDFLNPSTYKEKTNDTGKTSLYQSKADEKSPKLGYMERITSEDTTILYKMYSDGKLPENSYVVAFDPTVLFINKKILSETGNSNAIHEKFESISKILSIDVGEEKKLITVNETDRAFYSQLKSDNSYYEPLEEFCLGDVAFYIGHVSDIASIGEALPGLYEIMEAPEIDGVRAVGYEWRIGDESTEDEVNVAQLLLSYIIGDDAQDSLFVQSGYMIPVNPKAVEKYFEFNPNLKFIQDKLDKLEFISD